MADITEFFGSKKSASSTAVYAKELLNNFYDPDSRKVYDSFDIVVDGIDVTLDWNISLHWRAFRIKHDWIQEDENDDDTFTFIYKNQMEDKNLFPEFGNKVDDITEDLLIKFIDMIIAFLDDLKFDKKQGNFMTEKYIRKNIARRCCFGKFMRESSGGKCGICLDEEILTKTPCGHTLCIPCWTKLRGKSICPECRQDISFKNNC